MKKEKIITVFNQSPGECRSHDASKSYDVTLIDEREDLKSMEECKDECNKLSVENC